MPQFQLHTDKTAPQGSSEILAKVKERYGFIPNLGATIAESPPAFAGLLGLIEAFDRTTLTAPERELVLLAVSVANDCAYCRTVHIGLGSRAGLSRVAVTATLESRPLQDPRLNALRDLTVALVQSRGRVSDAQVEAFLGAGFSKAQVLEVVMGVALKTFTNYCNHLASVSPNPELVAMCEI
jgi:uncharacterized peroxidase-related enzyme